MIKGPRKRKKDKVRFHLERLKKIDGKNKKQARGTHQNPRACFKLVAKSDNRNLYSDIRKRIGRTGVNKAEFLIGISSPVPDFRDEDLAFKKLTAAVSA